MSNFETIGAYEPISQEQAFTFKDRVEELLPLLDDITPSQEQIEEARLSGVPENVINDPFSFYAGTFEIEGSEVSLSVIGLDSVTVSIRDKDTPNAERSYGTRVDHNTKSLISVFRESESANETDLTVEQLEDIDVYLSYLEAQLKSEEEKTQEQRSAEERESILAFIQEEDALEQMLEDIDINAYKAEIAQLRENPDDIAYEFNLEELDMQGSLYYLEKETLVPFFRAIGVDTEQSPLDANISITNAMLADYLQSQVDTFTAAATLAKKLSHNMDAIYEGDDADGTMTNADKICQIMEIWGTLHAICDDIWMTQELLDDAHNNVSS